MMHKAWSSIEEVPYCFSRSYVKLQGHTALKFIDFDPNWAIPDCISSLKSPMATKWCTKLEIALKRCPIVFSCDQAALWMVFSVCLSVRLSVCPSHLFDYVPIMVSSWNFQELSHRTRVMSTQKVKVGGQRSRSQRSQPNLTVSGLFEFTYDDEMIHLAWCCLGEVPYCFSRSSVKFQGHTALKVVKFDPDWAFPDCNSSLNSPIAMKCCTKLEVA